MVTTLIQIHDSGIAMLHAGKIRANRWTGCMRTSQYQSKQFVPRFWKCTALVFSTQTNSSRSLNIFCVEKSKDLHYIQDLLTLIHCSPAQCLCDSPGNLNWHSFIAQPPPWIHRRVSSNLFCNKLTVKIITSPGLF